MKAVVATFNQEKALVGAFSVITNLRMELFEALLVTGLARMIRTSYRSTAEEDEEEDSLPNSQTMVDTFVI